MNVKKILYVLVVAATLLLIEFKIIPTASLKLKPWSRKTITPVEKIEAARFDLISTLREAGIEIISGPFEKNETNGLTVILKIKGRPLKVIFSSQKDPRSQLASLQLILKNVRMRKEFKKDRWFKVIDLTGSKAYASF